MYGYAILLHGDPFTSAMKSTSNLLCSPADSEASAVCHFYALVFGVCLYSSCNSPLTGFYQRVGEYTLKAKQPCCNSLQPPRIEKGGIAAVFLCVNCIFDRAMVYWICVYDLAVGINRMGGYVKTWPSFFVQAGHYDPIMPMASNARCLHRTLAGDNPCPQKRLAACCTSFMLIALLIDLLTIFLPEMKLFLLLIGISIPLPNHIQPHFCDVL